MVTPAAHVSLILPASASGQAVSTGTTIITTATTRLVRPVVFA
jgi:hypothetical protein